MQILKVKSITEFESAEIPAGTLLVFPEQQTDGSYLWRCKDTDGNTGTIGSAGNITSVNGQTGPDVVLEPSDLEAVAEDLSTAYSRPDSLLAQMMFFLRNGAVNLYGTLSDLKNFMGGYFADTEHSHAIADVTELQTELDGKADAVAFSGFQVIVQGEAIQYFATLSEAVTYINTLDLSSLQRVTINCAPGTYTETEIFTMPEVPLRMNLNGAAITFSGGLTISAATTLKNGGITGSVSLAGELIAAFVSFTGDISAGCDMELINCNVVGNITVESSQLLIAGRLQLRGRLISAGRAVIGDRSWIIATDNTDPLVVSTGGSLMMTETLIINYGTGGGVSCDNGATLPLANAFADMAIVNGTVSAGSAVTILSSIYLTSEATGAAIIWLSAPGDHTHTAAEITDFPDAIESKLDKELLVPTTAVYIDGNRTDDYTEDGSIAYPYKTIAAATAAHQEAASYFIAAGTYAETAEINLYADSVVYGAYSTVSGSAINVGEGCYVHNLMFYNTVNVAVNGNTPMFHYCRFMGATMNLAGSTDFDGCYINSAATFNVTMSASYSLRAFNSSIHTIISAACRMYFNDCMFSVSSTDYVITSTGGLLSMVACLVYNTSTGGGISCDNGANGSSTCNFLVGVLANKDIACGTAVSIIGGDVQYSSLTGAAIVFPARLQAALAAKADTSTLTAHTSDTDNPHEVTQSQIGLENVDNTADSDKPVSTAMQAALDDKADTSTVSAHVADTDNPHGVTKTQVGLGDADNTADADKPVSTAQQTALDAKQDKGSAYSLGTALTGAISVDIANGDAQYGTLSGDVTLAYGSISNLDEGQGFILQFDNAAGQTFIFTAETTGDITILDTGSTGCYKIAFSKVNGKIYYDGKSEVYC